MNVLQQHEPSMPNPCHRLRLWPLPVILLSAGGVLWAVQSGTFSLTTRPSADFIYIIWSFQAIIFVWLMFLSRLGPIARVKWLLTILTIQLCLYLTIGVDGYAGDGRAILAWRWSTTPEERFAISLRDRHRVQKHDRPTVDLKTTSPLDSSAFRGRDRLGIVHGVRLARNWEVAPPKQLWRQPIGRGWSSFAVVGNYCVTQEQRGEDEVVACYELKTGREVWTHHDPARFFEGGPRAPPTIHHGRVYALGATGILNCLEGTTGKRIWSVDVLKSNNVSNRLFGMVGSPLVIDDMVIVSPGAKQSSLAAYHIEDGRKLWGGGSAEASYSSPQFAELAGRRQVLNFNGEGLFAHAVADGRVLWSYPWVSNPAEKNNVCQPVAIPSSAADGADRVFVSSGYGKGCAVFAVSKSGKGLAVRKVWSNRNLKAKFTSVVLRDGYIYGLDEGILTCIDLQTGNRAWKNGRYGHGQLILVEGILLIQAESGDVVLVEANPNAFRELTRFAALNDRTWNYPVLSGSTLLVRNDREAACFTLPVLSD